MLQSNIKPANVVTSIKQSSVLKGNFSCPVVENFIWIEPISRGHLSNKTTFSLFQMWSLNTGLTVYIYITLYVFIFPICLC
jgi:hypothetical protein